ncbi:Transmembrane channel [Echinococcus multilocularis]|uniref:Transmembrane channel n=1 Tax=Echinococcus multilocularis TaxID=6211 RepID=A0A0S4MMZ0_ECHMU|nr:Transmembrane channel [Echinococcus multilocularis]
MQLFCRPRDWAVEIRVTTVFGIGFSLHLGPRDYPNHRRHNDGESKWLFIKNGGRPVSGVFNSNVTSEGQI